MDRTNQLMKRRLCGEADADTISRALLRLGHIDRHVVDSVSSDHQSETKWKVLFENIPDFSVILDGLSMSGYHKLYGEFSANYQSVIKLSNTVAPKRILCSTTFDKRFLHFKILVHENLAWNHSDLLENICTTYRRNLQLDSNIKDKTRYADFLTACLFVKIDTKALFGQPVEGEVAELKSLRSKTSNTLTTDAGLHSRMAYKDGLEGGKEEEIHMAAAFVASYQLDRNSQMVVNLVYIEFAHKCKNAVFTDMSDIEELTTKMNGILSEYDSEDDGVIFWKGMLLLRHITFVLGISHTGTVEDVRNLTQAHIDNANRHLANYKQLIRDPLFLQKMVYLVAGTRVAEFELYQTRKESTRSPNEENNLRQGVKRLDEMVKEDPNRHFKETELVMTYSEWLKTNYLKRQSPVKLHNRDQD